MIVLVSIESGTRRLWYTMPSLLRFLAVLALIAGLGYAAMFVIASVVDLQPREITVRVPQDRFVKQR